MNPESLEWQSRTNLLIGTQGIAKLKNAHVLIAGVGGVGGYVAEQLCRAGLGQMSIVDNDVVQTSNRNRQLIAMSSTENKPKVQLFEERLKDINPDLKLNIITDYILDDNIDPILEEKFDYVVDAIDTLTPKVNFIEKVYHKGMPLVSSMGAGGRMDPTKVEIADISKSHHCKFAYIVRKYLHRRGIYKGIKVVFSSESVPKSALLETNGENNKRSVVGTISYMPAIFGCYCSSVVICELAKKSAL